MLADRQPGVKLVDTHAHLDEIENIDEAIEEAKNAGVAAIVAVGQDRSSNSRVLELADQYDGFVFAALGLHPWTLGAMTEAELDRTLDGIEANIERAVAVGEIGLDYHKRVKEVSSKERQVEAFRLTLELARKHSKPVSIHSRYSWKDAFDLTLASGVSQAVFHWYTGLAGVLREIIERGYCISATPAVEYHYEHRRAVRECPLENLLLETDSPVRYGEQTKWEARPASIARVLGPVAEIKCMEPARVAKVTTENAYRFFGLG
ncbi:MAG: TatD family hydrolase [Dehalococcoidia bacterium]|nr:TatD family hydrolase [Dehalococcoidia bacterium]